MFRQPKPVCCLNIFPKIPLSFGFFAFSPCAKRVFPIKMRCETIRSNVLEVFSCFLHNDHLRILFKSFGETESEDEKWKKFANEFNKYHYAIVRLDSALSSKSTNNEFIFYFMLHIWRFYSARSSNTAKLNSFSSRVLARSHKAIILLIYERIAQIYDAQFHEWNYLLLIIS